jgi:hypothetical protein
VCSSAETSASVVLSYWFVVIVTLAERGHIDMTLREKLSARVVVDEYRPAPFLLDDDGRGGACLPKKVVLL